jgi:hypothetical protein
MPPQVWSQVLGLLLFVLLVLALRAAHRAFTAVAARRLYRMADRPLPGRTRDLTGTAVRRAS